MATSYTSGGKTYYSQTEFNLLEVQSYKQSTVYYGEYGLFIVFLYPNSGYAWNSNYQYIDEYSMYTEYGYDSIVEFCNDYKYTYEGYGYGVESFLWRARDTQLYDGTTKWEA